MKKYIALLTTMLVSLFAINSFAWAPPPPPINGGYVVDLSNKLTQNQISQLNKKVEAVNQSTKNEMGALVLASMDGENIEDVAQATFRAWGLGKKGLDNGVLVVIAIAERKSRIQTGKGVEGDLPDLKCNDILKNSLNPNIKRGDFYNGLDSTFSAIASSIESRRAAATAKPVVREQDQERPRPAVGGCSVSSPGLLADGSNARGVILLVLTMSTFFGLLVYSIVRRAAKRARLEQELEEQEARNIRLERSRIRREQELRAQMLRQEEEENNRVTTKMQAVTVVKPAPEKKTVSVKKETVVAAAASATSLAAAALLASQEKEAVAAKLRAERDAAEARARRKRQDEERAESARRRRDEESSRSSYSSGGYSSGSDWGSSSSGGFDSGGSGFGGGDSGGGGSSSDW